VAGCLDGLFTEFIEPACLVASRSEEELRKPRREGGKVAEARGREGCGD
jgi:hypothetical protein